MSLFTSPGSLQAWCYWFTPQFWNLLRFSRICHSIDTCHEEVDSGFSCPGVNIKVHGPKYANFFSQDAFDVIREGVWVAQTDVDRPHTEIRLSLLKKIEHLHRTTLQMLCRSHEIYFLALLNACCSSHVPTCIAQLYIYVNIYIYLCLHCPKRESRPLRKSQRENSSVWWYVAELQTFHHSQCPGRRFRWEALGWRAR